jgi:hypothetical protein
VEKCYVLCNRTLQRGEMLRNVQQDITSWINVTYCVTGHYSVDVTYYDNGTLHRGCYV